MGSVIKKSALLLGVLCALGLAPGVAMASSTSIIQDCTDDGTLNGKYTASQLKNALGHIPSDTNQYYSCDSLINQELLDQLNKKTKKSGSGAGADDGSNAFISKAQRKAIGKKVAVASELDDDAPIPSPAGTAIKRAAGQTLASTSTPGVPTALIVAVIGMFILFAVELAGRVRKRRGRLDT
jgi:hypothetical protein